MNPSTKMGVAHISGKKKSSYLRSKMYTASLKWVKQYLVVLYTLRLHANRAIHLLDPQTAPWPLHDQQSKKSDQNTERNKVKNYQKWSKYLVKNDQDTLLMSKMEKSQILDTTRYHGQNTERNKENERKKGMYFLIIFVIQSLPPIYLNQVAPILQFEILSLIYWIFPQFENNCTAIPYRESTGFLQGIPCVVFQPLHALAVYRV